MATVVREVPCAGMNNAGESYAESDRGSVRSHTDGSTYKRRIREEGGLVPGRNDAPRNRAGVFDRVPKRTLRSTL